MDNKREQIEPLQGGSGSSEQTNNNRQEQKLPTTDLSGGEKMDIASEIGEDKNSVSTISDLGGMSGRDDSSGGSNDKMEGQNTNERTDKP